MSDKEKQYDPSEQSSLFDLEFHESGTVSDSDLSMMFVSRVPNGWIYTILVKGAVPSVTSCFVPEFIGVVPKEEETEEDEEFLTELKVCLNNVLMYGVTEETTIQINKMIRVLNRVK